MMLNEEVVDAIVFGRPGISFKFSTSAPDEEAADLTGLDWPADAGTPPTLAEVVAWHTQLQSECDAKTTEAATSKNDLITQYQIGMTRLDGIITNGPTYTTAQARDAIVDMAKIQKQMLRFIKAALT
jgi:hypothetical protein